MNNTAIKIEIDRGLITFITPYGKAAAWKRDVLNTMHLGLKDSLQEIAHKYSQQGFSHLSHALYRASLLA